MVEEVELPIQLLAVLPLRQGWDKQLGLLVLLPIQELAVLPTQQVEGKQGKGVYSPLSGSRLGKDRNGNLKLVLGKTDGNQVCNKKLPVVYDRWEQLVGNKAYGRIEGGNLVQAVPTGNIGNSPGYYYYKDDDAIWFHLLLFWR